MNAGNLGSEKYPNTISECCREFSQILLNALCRDYSFTDICLCSSYDHSFWFVVFVLHTTNILFIYSRKCLFHLQEKSVILFSIFSSCLKICHCPPHLNDIQQLSCQVYLHAKGTKIIYNKNKTK